jgi:hypothetical protein
LTLALSIGNARLKKWSVNNQQLAIVPAACKADIQRSITGVCVSAQFVSQYGPIAAVGSTLGQMQYDGQSSTAVPSYSSLPERDYFSQQDVFAVYPMKQLDPMLPREQQSQRPPLPMQSRHQQPVCTRIYPHYIMFCFYPSRGTLFNIATLTVSHELVCVHP